MYGWRGRLGLIIPSSTTIEPEFYGHLPDGVSLHTSRMYLPDAANAEALSEMAENAEQCARLLSTADVDCISYACTTGSMLEGPGFDKDIEARLARVSDVPCVATAAAVRRAFDQLGINRVAIATPYLDELNEIETEFLEANGITIPTIEGLSLATDTEIGELTSETAYTQAKSVYQEDVDGVFISCTNYRTFEIIERLEADLGVPVVTSNQATLWNSLQKMDLDTSQLSLGALFEE